MAQSLKNYTFTTLADKKDAVLGDDYIHGALETWKIKGKTGKGGKWDYKGKIKHNQKEGQLSGSLSDEVKIQFPYDRYYFWFGSKRNGDLKIHADFGNLTVAGKELNFFSNLKTQINFKTFAFRFGANYFGENLTVSNRVETFCNGGNSNLSFTNRTFLQQNQLFYGLVTSFGLTDGFALKKYDAIVGYEKDETSVYVEHYSGSNSNGLGKVVGSAFLQKDSNTFGVEVSNDFQNNDLDASLGVETTCEKHNHTLKAKINKGLDLELAYKKQINEQLKVTASGKLALSKGAKAVDFSKYVPIPFGVQFELNV